MSKCALILLQMKEEKNLMHNLRNVAPNLFNLSESNEHDFAEEEKKIPEPKLNLLSVPLITEQTPTQKIINLIS